MLAAKHARVGVIVLRGLGIEEDPSAPRLRTSQDIRSPTVREGHGCSAPFVALLDRGLECRNSSIIRRSRRIALAYARATDCDRILTQKLDAHPARAGRLQCAMDTIARRKELKSAHKQDRPEAGVYSIVNERTGAAPSLHPR